MLLILGIDIGIVNLACAEAVVTDDFEDLKIRQVNLVNLMKLEHNRVPLAECPLFHTGMAVDRVAHLVQERQALFDAAHTIVVERQPPGGLRDVEQVLVSLFRHKAVVMAPQTMHAFIGSSCSPYSIRKQLAIAFAETFVPSLTTLFPVKADDAADAVCLACTFVHKMRTVRRKAAGRARADAVATKQGLCLADYVYTGKMGGGKKKPLPV
jgi:hypothetical protein